MFSLSCALPSPTSADGSPSLFGWFTGNTAQSDFSNPCTSALWFMAFADRPDRQTKACWSTPGSRAYCLISVPGFFDYSGPHSHSRITRLPYCLPATLHAVGILYQATLRSSIAGPTAPSVYASTDTSRRRLQDSRPGWIRCLLSRRALASPTTCRFIPALGGLWPIRTEPSFSAWQPISGWETCR